MATALDKAGSRLMNGAGPDKLHIGFVLPSIEGGGAQRVFLTLAETLIKRGHRVDIVMGRFNIEYIDSIPAGVGLYYPRLWNADTDLLRRCRERGAAAHAMGVNPMAAARARYALGRKRFGLPVKMKHSLYAYIVSDYIRRQSPDLLMSALPAADAAAVYGAALTDNSVPAIVSIHTNVKVNARYSPEELEMARELYPKATAVVGISNGVSYEAHRWLGVSVQNLRTINNPVPAAKIQDMARGDMAHPWFESGEPPVIISVGNEAPGFKDYFTIVEAFGLARRAIEARLLIMGKFSDSHKSELMSSARRYGADRDLKFMDFDENPFRYMRGAALFVLSSYCEGLPMVMLESLACGTPVVSTDTPYGPSDILDGGKLGKLTPVGSAEDMARAMVETLRGDAPPEEALTRRAEDFSCEKVADEYLRLFQKVLR